jgi:hypothetical protein
VAAAAAVSLSFTCSQIISHSTKSISSSACRNATTLSAPPALLHAEEEEEEEQEEEEETVVGCSRLETKAPAVSRAAPKTVENLESPRASKVQVCSAA